MLWEAKGRIVTYGSIAEACEKRTEYYMHCTQLIASHIKHMRKALRKSGYPIEIFNHNRIGYSVRVTDPDWVAPWDEA